MSKGHRATCVKQVGDVIDNATPLVLGAIADVPEAACADGFRLSDMGCADGGTSLEMITSDAESNSKD